LNKRNGPFHSRFARELPDHGHVGRHYRDRRRFMVDQLALPRMRAPIAGLAQRLARRDRGRMRLVPNSAPGLPAMNAYTRREGADVVIDVVMRVENISKTYGAGAQKVHAISDL